MIGKYFAHRTYQLRLYNMPIHNVRKQVTESYDPKQRVVGGVVLSLIMLLIYSILKLVLGFSSVPAGEYILSEPLIDEVSTNIASAGGSSTTTANARLSQRTNYRLPQKFVFLDLKGNPMQPEELSAPNQGVLSAAGIYNSVDNQGKWYVQAASFKKAHLAKRLVQKIKNKKIADIAYIVETSNGWYAVRLSPQDSKNLARQQNRKLQSIFGITGMVKKVRVK